MARITPLWRSSDISIHRFDHPHAHEDHDPYEEVAERYSASFVETGEFVVEIGEARWKLGPGDVLLNYPGMRFRAGHDGAAFADVCLTVACDNAGADFDPARTWARAAAPVLKANNRLRYLYWAMARGIKADAPLLAETVAAELFREIPESSSDPRPLYKDRKLSWYAERVQIARETLERDFERDHRLQDLARAAGMSTFHFARVFAALIGAPPHRHLLETRLAAAASMLRQGRGVTETCFAAGFNNLSHFSRQFARRFGRNPSAYVS